MCMFQAFCVTEMMFVKRPFYISVVLIQEEIAETLKWQIAAG